MLSRLKGRGRRCRGSGRWRRCDVCGGPGWCGYRARHGGLSHSGHPRGRCCGIGISSAKRWGSRIRAGPASLKAGPASLKAGHAGDGRAACSWRYRLDSAWIVALAKWGMAGGRPAECAEPVAFLSPAGRHALISRLAHVDCVGGEAPGVVTARKPSASAAPLNFEIFKCSPNGLRPVRRGSADWSGSEFCFSPMGEAGTVNLTDLQLEARGLEPGRGEVRPVAPGCESAGSRK
jgi:hypothetical protein